jgi:hypothetical protein
MADKPTICPVCWDNQLEIDPNLVLRAVHGPEGTRTLAVEVYRCSNWHFFAVLTRDESRVLGVAQRKSPDCE